MEDVVAYEVHVQDFTDLLPVSDGPARHVRPPRCTRPVLKNAAGAPVGIDHVAALGGERAAPDARARVPPLPGRREEWAAAFADDPFLREMGIADENYQWGYRTTHALAIEGRYRAARGPSPAPSASGSATSSTPTTGAASRSSSTSCSTTPARTWRARAGRR